MVGLYVSSLDSPCFFKAGLDHVNIASMVDVVVSSDHSNLVSNRELVLLMESGHHSSEGAKSQSSQYEVVGGRTSTTAKMTLRVCRRGSSPKDRGKVICPSGCTSCLENLNKLVDMGRSSCRSICLRSKALLYNTLTELPVSTKTRATL